MFKKIFYTADQTRLRSGWRLSIQTILFVILIILTGPLALLIPAKWGWLSEEMLYFFSNSLVIAIAVTLSVILACIYLDKRAFINLGLKFNRRSAIDILAGIGISAVQLSLIFLIFWLAGWLKPGSYAWQAMPVFQVLAGVAIMLLIFSMVSWGEELLARGYWLQNIEEGLNLPWAVCLSSLGFALFHFLNPNVTWQAIVYLFASGLFFAYAYYRTRRLWLPIGLHLGWNFFEGSVFGFPVSGGNAFSLMKPIVNGPTTLTGGAFGPEGGVIILLALALGIGLVWVYTKNTARSSNSI